MRHRGSTVDSVAATGLASYLALATLENCYSLARERAKTEQYNECRLSL